MAIEIVDLSIKNGGSFHSYVSLPEGKSIDFRLKLGMWQGGFLLDAGSFLAADSSSKWRIETSPPTSGSVFPCQAWRDMDDMDIL